MTRDEVVREFTESWDGIEVLSTKRMAEEIVDLRERLAWSETRCRRLDETLDLLTEPSDAVCDAASQAYLRLGAQFGSPWAAAISAATTAAEREVKA